MQSKTEQVDEGSDGPSGAKFEVDQKVVVFSHETHRHHLGCVKQVRHNGEQNKWEYRVANQPPFVNKWIGEVDMQSRTKESIAKVHRDSKAATLRRHSEADASAAIQSKMPKLTPTRRSPSPVAGPSRGVDHAVSGEKMTPQCDTAVDVEAMRQVLAVSSEFRAYVTAELEDVKSELKKVINEHKKHDLHQMREQQRMQQELQKVEVERDEERQKVKELEAMVTKMEAEMKTVGGNRPLNLSLLIQQKSQAPPSDQGAAMDPIEQKEGN